MPPLDHESSSSVPFSAIRRVISSIRSDQVHAMELNKDAANVQNAEFELFQKHVFDRFHDLSEAASDEFLSIAWIQKLLDAFFSCLEEFRVLLSNNTDRLQKPAMDKILSEFFDKSIKALDICNAIRDGIEKIRVWQKHLEIVLSALDGKQRTATGEGNFRRARKALMELALMMLDEKESGSSVFQQRNRSFGRHNSVGKDRQSKHSRSLSWSVSRSWSASKQLQSIANNLVPPRGNDVIASNGLANPIYTMSAVLMFVLWTLVAAIPCQDRGGSMNAHFSFGRQLIWATPLVLVQERIMEEGRKREHRSSCNGLMKEVVDMERCVRRLTELVDWVRFPVTEERKEEVGKGVEELERIVNAWKKSNDPLERQLRQIFHKIMSCRTEGLELLNQAK